MSAPPPLIRTLTDYGELKRAVEFQRLIWGASFSELVPAVVFWFASRTGGIIAGAFEGNEMVGLLFGMTGWDGARPLHWSDMLAVLPSHRGRGLGFALKRYQREKLLENGVATVNWTFDPLEARNAHLNFARLGVTSHEYIRDCYGVSDSPLHQGIGTDRLVVTWDLDSPRVRRRMEGGEAGSGDGDGEEINPEGGPVRLDLSNSRVRLRIPADIQTLKSLDPSEAREWREVTRAGFEAYIGRGYVVREMVRGGGGGWYLLEKG